MTYFVLRNAEKLPSIFLAVCKQEETNKGREPRKPCFESSAGCDPFGSEGVVLF